MNQKMVSADEYNEVRNLITNYVEAVKNGDIDMLAEVFHKNSMACGTVNGELVGGIAGSNPTIEFIKQHGKSSQLVYSIDVLDITPTSAMVRVITEKDAIGTDCTEYLTLVKLNEGWTIISKVFHQF